MKLTPSDPKRRRALFAVLAVTLVVGVVVLSSALKADPPTPKEVPLSELLSKASDGKLSKVEMDDTTRTAVATPVGAGKDPSPDEQLVAGYPYPYADEIVTQLVDAGVEVDAEPEPDPPSTFLSFLLSLLPMAMILGFLAFFLMRKGGFGPNTALRRSQVEVPTTRFADVAGHAEAVEDLSELTSFLHDPDQYAMAGARVPTGVLLVGPPGTGKTLLARALAGEAGVPFFALSGSDFVETFVGVGASRVRSVFAQARKHHRAIIFIDEIDAIGRARVAQPQGGAEERESTLNQLLVEMDGFHSSGVLILAATNRPDILDKALLRPGRFDRRIAVPPPDRPGRLQILEMYAKRLDVAADVDLTDVARRTPGLTGADLENLTNEAAILAARAGRTTLTRDDFDEALSVVALGRARSSAQVTDRDRAITAWHEAGHAVTALVDPLVPDPVQVTIIPRGAAGGATWSGGRDEAFETAAELRSQLVNLLGGRAAEEVLLEGDHTPGAASDFKAATDLATKMVCEWGMSPLGIVRLDPDTADGRLSAAVHTHVTGLLDDALDQARATLKDHSELLGAVAAELLAEETIRLEDLEALRAQVGDE